MIEENGVFKLMLTPEAVGAEVLSELVGFLEVSEFRSEEPGLNEIFVKAVRLAGQAAQR